MKRSQRTPGKSQGCRPRNELEREILPRVAWYKDLPARLIAERLGVSTRSVERYRRMIREAR